MIRLALVGAARILFHSALLAFLVGAGMLYLSYRLLRSAVAKDAGRPVREAGFGVLVALAGLGRALQTAGLTFPEKPVQSGNADDHL